MLFCTVLNIVAQICAVMEHRCANLHYCVANLRYLGRSLRYFALLDAIRKKQCGVA